MSKQDVKEKDRTGSILDNKYEILREVGRGGMSVVYLARDVRLNKLWAVKEFKQTGNRIEDEVYRKSLLEEANLMKSLSHPALPRIVDIIEADETIFIVMDYIEGEDLRSVMKRRGAPMDQADVIDWGIQLCDVLSYLHTPDPSKGKPSIVYRDMKPENVMLRDDGTVCLIDFGIARKFDEMKTSDTTTLGTHGYASPEQFDSTVQTDWRSDIYSLGATMHNLLTRESPKKNIYHLLPIRSYNPQLSEGLEAIVAKCVRYNREERYQSCQEIAYDLEHYETLTTAYRKKLKSKVHIFQALAISAVVCLAIGVAGMVMTNVEKHSTYESYLEAGDKIELGDDASPGDDDYDDKVKAYTNAIETDPSQSEPYEKLLEEVYTQDGELQSEETGDYYDLLKKYAKGSCSSYGSLCYKFALYRFAYTDSYSQAKEWFEEAVDTGTLEDEQEENAEIYIAICEFRENITKGDATGEGGDTDSYREYWEGLADAYDAMLKADVQPRAKLKLCQLMVQACSGKSYLSSFRRAGIEEEELLEQLDSIEEFLADLEEEIQDDSEDESLFLEIQAYLTGGTDSDGVERPKAADEVTSYYNSTTTTATATDDADDAEAGE